jgi:hypothetical protein
MIRFHPADASIAWRGAARFQDNWRGIINPFLCHLGGGSQGSTAQILPGRQNSWEEFRMVSPELSHSMIVAREPVF